jgi:phosphoglycerate dehydrogenase-like enzyme
MSGKVGVLTSSQSDVDRYQALGPEGVEFVLVDPENPVAAQAKRLKGVTAIIAPSYLFPAELARACPELKLVQVTGAGTDRMNLEELASLGIQVANHGGGKAAAVAEHTITLMLMVSRKTHLAVRSVKTRDWHGDFRTTAYSPHELTGKTVGIIGLGYIGQQVARRLQGWECRLVYHDIAARPSKLEEELHITRVAMDDLLRTSDIVALIVSLTKHTVGMIGERELELMKPTAILVNTCRGPVVDEAALIKALREGKIAAAGLDVLDPEPPTDDNPLLDMDNVVITPHMSSSTPEAGEKSSAFAAMNAARVALGGEPQSVVQVD